MCHACKRYGAKQPFLNDLLNMTYKSKQRSFPDGPYGPARYYLGHLACKCGGNYEEYDADTRYCQSCNTFNLFRMNFWAIYTPKEYHERIMEGAWK